MKELIDFAIVYSPNDEDQQIAIALRDQLLELGFTGDLYLSSKIPNETTLVDDVVAKFFIASSNEPDDAYINAKTSLTKTHGNLTIPVWLSPGKDALGLKDQYSGFESIQGVIATRNSENDLDYVKSNQFKNGLSRQIKATIEQEKKSIERERYSKDEYRIGLKTKDIVGRRKIACEKATVCEDILGHEEFAEKIATALVKNKDFDTPATIGILAPWGSGKTQFINFIKKHCKTEGDFEKRFIAEKNVNCCCCDTLLRWWCKLILWTLCVLLLTAALILGITYIYVIAPHLQTCQWNDTVTPEIDNRYTNESVTTLTLNVTNAPPTTETSNTACMEADYWYLLLIGGCGIALLILLTSCCQRKYYRDCKIMCIECCCCFDELTVDRKNEILNPDRKPVCINCCVGKTKKSDNSQNQNQNRTGLKKKDCGKWCCLDLKTFAYMTFFNPSGVKYHATNSEDNEDDKHDDISIITVDFNAWEYSGCDFLWAGMVSTLGNKVEDFFGKYKVRLCRIFLDRLTDENANTPPSYSYTCCLMRHKLYMLLLLALFILAVIATLLAILGSKYEDAIKQSRLWIGVAAILATLAPVTTAIIVVVRALMKSTEGLVQQISTEMRDKNTFREELGFMHKIKEEVHHITNVVNFMSRLYGCKFRVLLVIDDLDRCQADRIMGVLEAVTLLLEPSNDIESPYVSILAIDPRIVLGAIENHFGSKEDYTQANVNGYEYLKKIIHMPFCLPSPTVEEKRNFINRLLQEKNEPRQYDTDGSKSVSGINTPTAVPPSPSSTSVKLDRAVKQNGGISARRRSTQDSPSSPSGLRSILECVAVGSDPYVHATAEYPTGRSTYASNQTMYTPKQSPSTDCLKIVIPINTAGQSRGDTTPQSQDSPVKVGSKTDPMPIMEERGTVDELMEYVRQTLQETRLLQLMHGNPRSVKRICNIILLALSVFKEDGMTKARSFELLLVVVMIEQWPFRTSFLLQYCMKHIQEGTKSKESKNDRKQEQKMYGRVRVLDTVLSQSAVNLEDTELFEIWDNNKGILREVSSWKKFLSYDWDPELFQVFIDTFRLTFRILKENIYFAVNHDTNIEAIVEQGLSEFYDLKENRTNPS